MQSKIVQATPAHMIALLQNPRARELKAFQQFGEGYDKLAIRTLAQSIVAFTGLFDDEPVVIWGLTSHSFYANSGWAWMIVSAKCEEHPFVVARHSREALSMLKQYFEKIEGAVDASFECSVKWLEWLGFKLGPEDNGIRRFEWTR